MSPPIAAPADSVEAFAALCARLDNPFSPRTATLAEAGLSEEDFARLSQRWADRLSAGGIELGQVFAEAYAAARRPLPEASRDMDSALREPPPEPAETPSLPGVPEPARLIVPSFMRAPEPAPHAPLPAPELPANPSRAATWTETGPVDLHRISKPSVPFHAGGSSKMTVPTAPAATPQKARALDGTETVELRLSPAPGATQPSATVDLAAWIDPRPPQAFDTTATVALDPDLVAQMLGRRSGRP